MSDPTFYLTKYSCPLFVPNIERKVVDLVGTSIPVYAEGRFFLVTAAHVVQRFSTSELLYPTDHINQDSQDVVGLCDEKIGVRLAQQLNKHGQDDVDLGVIEIPPGKLSSKYTTVPKYMIADSINLNHIGEITLIGYPSTRNKYRYNSLISKVNSQAYILKHKKSIYESQGLNPLIHFCVEFNEKQMQDEKGNPSLPPDPHGISGGPAWYVTETAKRAGTDEGAQLVGIVTDYEKESKVIWGVRMSYVFITLSRTFPELSEGFEVKMNHLTKDPEDISNYMRVRKKV